ncbi:hypothetical protein AVEN_257679-1 [Araneus ventricosus]|uniref:Bro-N domain-containing protein n=1 Tax=Araneus ventricosus TaxID=182803 RepID=A0A4Y2LHN4_ARAVE|nr:hypothetical protein AVEN_257679-1 [Araneus ventricosus]
MTDHRWIHFYIPPSTFSHQKNNLPYEMIVYRDHNNELHFFGNTVAWCLGHTVPHKAIQQLVDADKLYTLSWGSGQFLKEEGVYQLAGSSDPNNAMTFLPWFSSYLQTCKQSGGDPSICPP